MRPTAPHAGTNGSSPQASDGTVSMIMPEPSCESMSVVPRRGRVSANTADRVRAIDRASAVERASGPRPGTCRSSAAVTRLRSVGPPTARRTAEIAAARCADRPVEVGRETRLPRSSPAARIEAPRPGSRICDHGPTRLRSRAHVGERRSRRPRSVWRHARPLGPELVLEGAPRQCRAVRPISSVGALRTRRQDASANCANVSKSGRSRIIGIARTRSRLKDVRSTPKLGRALFGTKARDSSDEVHAAGESGRGTLVPAPVAHVERARHFGSTSAIRPRSSPSSPSCSSRTPCTRIASRRARQLLSRARRTMRQPRRCTRSCGELA